MLFFSLFLLNKASEKGTRITIDIIQEMLSEGADIEDITFFYEIEKETIKEISEFYQRA